jgi:hypothetical protein
MYLWRELTSAELEFEICGIGLLLETRKLRIIVFGYFPCFAFLLFFLVL